MTRRRTIAETWDYLSSRGEEMPRTPDGAPFVQARMPRFDDPEPLSFMFFRTESIDADFSECSLPRTFFGRSLLQRVRFSGTDLAESCMCWNDFEACDFGQADLSRCDLRSSNFPGCWFGKAVLRGADLRGATFADCDFAGADLTGATADDRPGVESLRARLSPAQQATVQWTADPGPEPPGG